MFFSITIGINISFAVVLLVPGVPAIYRLMLSVLTLGLANARACRVYRAVKLGSIQDFPSTYSPSRRSLKTLRFNTTPRQLGDEHSFERPTFAESLVDMTNI
jgi:hypothetical protein